MTQIHVVGLGMDGIAGLAPDLQALVQNATVLAGSDRHLAYVQSHVGKRIPLTDLSQAIAQIRRWVEQVHADSDDYVIILTSGDPLFFGLGRLLLAELPAEWLTFHPSPSSVQLAFSRIKTPWQDAELISIHGRSPDLLLQAIQRQSPKIAVLTDTVQTPQAIAHMIAAADLTHRYTIWVCEDLGAETEHVRTFKPDELVNSEDLAISPLNVVILLRKSPAETVSPASLPKFGIADSAFASFSDRPNLMTKREVRVLAIAELALQDQQVVWDVGAGTGSVAVEIARLCPSSQVYAVEKTAAGISLINQNKDRFNVDNLTSIHGTAPGNLKTLPKPDRVFIGGSGGHLVEILTTCQSQLRSNGCMVLAIATLEHLSQVTTWAEQNADTWQTQFLQVQLARSVPVAALTRFSPINPVTLVQITRLPKKPSSKS